MTVKNAPNLPPSRKANKAGVAEFFGVSVPAVDGWIRRGCPAVQRGQRGVPWVFDLLQVAEWRFAAPAVDDDGEEQVPRDPQDKWYYYKAERERITIERELRHLIPDDEVAREFSRYTKMIAAFLESLPDNLERDHGLDGEVLDSLQRRIDGLREQLYSDYVSGDDNGD